MRARGVIILIITANSAGFLVINKILLTRGKGREEKTRKNPLWNRKRDGIVNA